MSLEALRQQFAEEAEACDHDGSAINEWIEARAIDEEELQGELLLLLAGMLAPNNHPISGLMIAFRLGYELAVQTEREAFLGSDDA